MHLVPFTPPSRSHIKHAAAGAAIACALVAAAACGGSKSSATSATSTASATATPAGRFGNRTPNPQFQTAIAQGTMPARGGRGGIATAIAQGTPAASLFPNSDDATAYAEGTPVGGARGGGGRGQVLPAVAAFLSITEDQLSTELQASGATIASVAAAHGQTRDALKQAIIAATQQRESDAVTSGRITQDQADQALSQLESNLDSLVDSDGSGGGFGGSGMGGGPGGGPPGQ